MSVPCKDCLVFIQCKDRLHRNNDNMVRGVVGLAESEKCPELSAYLVFSSNGKEAVNNVRKIFDLPFIDYIELKEKHNIVSQIPDFRRIKRIAVERVKEKNNERSMQRLPTDSRM